LVDMTKPYWFEDVPFQREHQQRIGNVLDIKQYFLRIHKVLQRPNFKFKGEAYTTAKIVLQTLKIIENFHASYVLGNPVSITGEQGIVKEFNRIYKKGRYNTADYQIAQDLAKYGNAFEYDYMDNNGVVKPHIIANETAYPVYDDAENYIAFVEYWKDADTGTAHYYVYYPNKVQIWKDNVIQSEKPNLTGLPIHYASLDKTAYNFFGDAPMNDLIPIMDKIENLLSKLDDAITTLSLNPMGVCAGRTTDTSVSKDMCGEMLVFEAGGNFQYANATLDYNSIKLELDNLIQQLYTIACVPSAVVGQSNIANVSEISLKLLFSQSDNRAKQMTKVLKDGFFQRFIYFRKLLALQNKTFSDDDFDEVDITFNYNRPVDTQSMMKELKTQYDMGAISKQTVIDLSPYTTNTALELQRLQDSNDKDKNNGIKQDTTIPKRESATQSDKQDNDKDKTTTLIQGNKNKA